MSNVGWATSTTMQFMLAVGVPLRARSPLQAARKSSSILPVPRWRSLRGRTERAGRGGRRGSVTVRARRPAWTHFHQARPASPSRPSIDLDEVGPRTFRREDAGEFVAPLVELGRRINGDANDNEGALCPSVQLRAFGNLSTRGGGRGLSDRTRRRGRDAGRRPVRPRRGRGAPLPRPWGQDEAHEEEAGRVQAEGASTTSGRCSRRSSISTWTCTREGRGSGKACMSQGGKRRKRRGGKSALAIEGAGEARQVYEAAVVGLGSSGTSFERGRVGESQTERAERSLLGWAPKEAGVRISSADDLERRDDRVRRRLGRGTEPVGRPGLPAVAALVARGGDPPACSAGSAGPRARRHRANSPRRERLAGTVVGVLVVY
mmetsp:Transcript_17169/g.38645  ORF Transcript_17169/g.38645 Transcript_17169/m.38645 type:complete len:376 (-) Transcript_17169:967-2094(-)